MPKIEDIWLTLWTAFWLIILWSLIWMATTAHAITITTSHSPDVAMNIYIDGVLTHGQGYAESSYEETNWMQNKTIWTQNLSQMWEEMKHANKTTMQRTKEKNVNGNKV